MSVRAQNGLHVVFVDGIGGRRIFRRPLLARLAAAGHACHYFDYRPSRESLATIENRLAERLATVTKEGAYVLIGYSFGGVLARAMLANRPEVPRPARLMLVASPLHSLRMCRRVRGWPLFKWMTGDCGQLLASPSAMGKIPFPEVPTTCVYGTRGYAGPLALAGRHVNDGMMAVDEIDPGRYSDAVSVPVSHPFIPTHPRVIDVIENRSYA
jgi:pimeloyl-ACP methyl ester carboxylesterase